MRGARVLPMSDSAAPHPRRSFGERYLEKHGLTAADYERHLLARALYPHARLLRPLVHLLRPDHFAADLDLLRDVALIRRSRDLAHELNAFSHHPGNVGGLRRFFRVRISTSRLGRIVRETLHPSAGGDSATAAEGDHLAAR